MSIDRAAIGRVLPTIRTRVDPGWLRLFAQALGQDEPAHAPGSRVPVPPTFLFGLELDVPDPFEWLTDLGVDLRHVLHGEQSFTYHALAYAGDTLVASPRIADVYDRRSGELEFVVKQTEVAGEGGHPVADLTSVIVVRAGEAPR
jgi:hypothetical protein